MITKEILKEKIKSVETQGGVSWLPMGELPNGKLLCLVIGEIDNCIMGKLAINTSRLQCDYGLDWLMPTDQNGDVYDTEIVFVDKSENATSDDNDLENDVQWFTEQTELILKKVEKGELIYES